MTFFLFGSTITMSFFEGSCIKRTQNFLLNVFFALFFLQSFSQTKSATFQSPLWMKSEGVTLKKDKPFESKEVQGLKKYFNFNEIVPLSKSNFSQKTKGLIANQSSLFVVYKGTAAEVELLQLQKGNFKVQLTSKKIQIDKDIELNKGNPVNGMLVSCFFNRNSMLSKKLGTLTLSDVLFQDKKGENQILELIYLPTFLSGIEKNKIESYLALKYGISLQDSKNYYASSGQKIWDAKKNENYKYHVTGLALDHFYGLQQKQSGNHTHDGLYFGFTKLEKSNTENLSPIADQTYLLWGDNGKSLQYKEVPNQPYASIEKIWKVQTTSKNEDENLPFTQLVINKSEMTFSGLDKTGDETWLVIDNSNSKFNYASAEYIKATNETKEKLVFDQVKWKNNHNTLFTFVKAPAFFVVPEISFMACQESTTNKGFLKLAIAGGIAPFTIHLESTTDRKDLSVSDRQINLDNLSTGTYNLMVTDATQAKFAISFTVDTYHTNLVQMEKTYLKETGKKLVISPIVLASEEISGYEWLQQGSTLSKDPTLTVEELGNYTLIVQTKQGCRIEFPFEVKSDRNQLNSPWVVYPNPVSYGQTYSIQFALEKVSQVNYSIYDLNGKLIKNVDLGSIKDHVQVEQSLPIGNYLITLSIDGKTETTKLVIK